LAENSGQGEAKEKKLESDTSSGKTAGKIKTAPPSEGIGPSAPNGALVESMAGGMCLGRTGQEKRMRKVWRLESARRWPGGKKLSSEKNRR